jgi:hypothetical protein
LSYIARAKSGDVTPAGEKVLRIRAKVFKANLGSVAVLLRWLTGPDFQYFYRELKAWSFVRPQTTWRHIPLIAGFVPFWITTITGFG